MTVMTLGGPAGGVSSHVHKDQPAGYIGTDVHQHENCTEQEPHGMISGRSMKPKRLREDLAMWGSVRAVTPLIHAKPSSHHGANDDGPAEAHPFLLVELGPCQHTGSCSADGKAACASHLYFKDEQATSWQPWFTRNLGSCVAVTGLQRRKVNLPRTHFQGHAYAFSEPCQVYSFGAQGTPSRVDHKGPGSQKSSVDTQQQHTAGFKKGHTSHRKRVALQKVVQTCHKKSSPVAQHLSPLPLTQAPDNERGILSTSSKLTPCENLFSFKLQCQSPLGPNLPYHTHMAGIRASPPSPGGNTSACTKRVQTICYTGQVTAVTNYGGVLELDGRLKLVLTHYPAYSFTGLRLGSILRIWNVHPIFGNSRRVIGVGACSYSTVLVETPSDRPNIALLSQQSSLRGRVDRLPFEAALLFLDLERTLRHKLGNSSSEARALTDVLVKELAPTFPAPQRREVFAEFMAHAQACFLGVPLQQPPVLCTIKELKNRGKQVATAKKEEIVEGQGECVVAGWLRRKGKTGQLQLADATGTLDVVPEPQSGICHLDCFVLIQSCNLMVHSKPTPKSEPKPSELPPWYPPVHPKAPPSPPCFLALDWTTLKCLIPDGNNLSSCSTEGSLRPGRWLLGVVTHKQPCSRAEVALLPYDLTLEAYGQAVLQPRPGYHLGPRSLGKRQAGAITGAAASACLLNKKRKVNEQSYRKVQIVHRNEVLLEPESRLGCTSTSCAWKELQAGVKGILGAGMSESKDQFSEAESCHCTGKNSAEISLIDPSLSGYHELQIGRCYLFQAAKGTASSARVLSVSSSFHEVELSHLAEPENAPRQHGDPRIANLAVPRLFADFHNRLVSTLVQDHIPKTLSVKEVFQRLALETRVGIEVSLQGMIIAAEGGLQSQEGVTALVLQDLDTCHQVVVRLSPSTRALPAGLSRGATVSLRRAICQKAPNLLCTAKTLITVKVFQLPPEESPPCIAHPPLGVPGDWTLARKVLLKNIISSSASDDLYRINIRVVAVESLALYWGCQSCSSPLKPPLTHCRGTLCIDQLTLRVDDGSGQARCLASQACALALLNLPPNFSPTPPRQQASTFLPLDPGFHFRKAVQRAVPPIPSRLASLVERKGRVGVRARRGAPLEMVGGVDEEKPLEMEDRRVVEELLQSVLCRGYMAVVCKVEGGQSSDLELKPFTAAGQKHETYCLPLVRLQALAAQLVAPAAEAAALCQKLLARRAT